MKSGLTGILRPNGIFVECDYGNHCEIAEKIDKSEEMDCIYFSSNLYDIKSSLLYLNEDITNKQLMFFIKNIKSLDETQYKLWVEYIKIKIKN